MTGLDSDKYFTALQSISQIRKGGVYNIRGIIYQANYTVWRLLSEFTSNTTPEDLVFQAEGVEDLDYYYQLTDILTNEHIQIKCLDSSLDSDQFVNNILNNLLEVYIQAPLSKFRIVSNQHVTSGKMRNLKEFAHHQKTLSDIDLNYWTAKIRACSHSLSDDLILDFLSKIRFERHSENELLHNAQKIIIRHFNITLGNEQQFYQALFYAVLDWSRKKEKIRYADLQRVIESTRDDLFENHALREGWIPKITFNQQNDASLADAYFEGKAARPQHIAAGLPVNRPDWELEVLDALRDFDVTVILSSSGQGKSTLAWQVAKAMQECGFTVYELLEADISKMNDLLLFLESRLKIGIIPLVVIDGLNERVKEWTELAARAQNLRGVKFLVTTREEDWFRYGQKTSRLFLKPIHLELRENEALRIFDAFKKRNLIHPEMRNWQIAWEKVKSEKLLLEFVYLLTQGKMVRERLEEQLQTMRNEPENTAKKSILRLVSMADVLSLRIPTSNLTRFVKEQMNFHGDRNDLLKSLQDEYQVQIEGRFYTEGLHPVRSKHLTDLLHEALPLGETLVELFSVLDTNSLLGFAVNAPQMLESEMQRGDFFKTLAEKIVDSPYSEIVMVINGLFGSDAQKHWEENKDTYDQISSAIELYVPLMVPFERLAVGAFKEIPNFESNLQKIRELDITRSNTAEFVRHLCTKLQNRPLQNPISGAAALERWFERFGLSAGILHRLTIDDLKNAMYNLPAEALCLELLGIYLLNPGLLQEFYSRYELELKIKLLRETNSLVIESKDSETLEIRYLVDEQKSINEQSVSRIEVIAYCFPFYKIYDTAGIYFPNPVLNAIRASHDESIKHATWENCLKYDPFKTSANNTWLSVITQNYEFVTHFEWQQYWFKYRQVFLEWLKQSCRVLEAKMSAPQKISQEIERWKTANNKIATVTEGEMRIRYDEVHFKENRFKPSVGEISAWASLTYTLPFQFSKMFSHDDAGRILGLKAFEFRGLFLGMQSGFKEIAAQTGHYFDTALLEQQEIAVSKQFAELCQFFYYQFAPNPKLISSPRQAVKNWLEAKKTEEFQKLENIKATFDVSTDYELLLPNQIIKEPYFNSVVLGIRGVSLQEFDVNSKLIFASLLELTNIQATFFYLILVEDDTTLNNVAFRFSDDSLKKLDEFIDGKEITLPQPFTFPIPLTPEIVQYLPGIKMGEPNQDLEKAAILNLHNALWRYSETSTRLTLPGAVMLRKEKLRATEQQIGNCLENLKTFSNLFEKYEPIAASVISGMFIFNEMACNQFFLEDFS